MAYEPSRMRSHVAKAAENVGDLAQLWRIKGELLLLHSSPDAAAADFLRSLDLARTQHARAWELRAAISLARLPASTGPHGDRA